jgi:hypothetical protein
MTSLKKRPAFVRNTELWFPEAGGAAAAGPDGVDDGDGETVRPVGPVALGPEAAGPAGVAPHARSDRFAIPHTQPSHSASVAGAVGAEGAVGEAAATSGVGNRDCSAAPRVGTQ